LSHSVTESTTAAVRSGLSLDRLDRLDPDRILKGRNGTKADILRYDLDGGRVALKDYRGRPPWVRATVGRFLISRESRGYMGAGDLEGLPRFLGRLGPVSLATEWVDATPLAQYADQHDGPPPAELFDRLDRILDAMHRRKVALSDLHHRDVLISPEGDVHVVDLAMAYRYRSNPAVLRPFRLWLFGHLCRLDRIAAARMRARFTGGNMDEAVQGAGGGTSGLYRAGRKLKAILRGGRK
jgi:hypothetical protein